MAIKVVYLMRGLPGCGKSYTAKKLAGDSGVILETDEYFYSQVGDDTQCYDYDDALLEEAREWNLNRFRKEVDANRPLIIVDRGNGLNAATRVYIDYAMQHGYDVQFREPDSPWWNEVRVLLKYKHFITASLFEQLADELSKRTRGAHRVPAKLILRWMNAWRHDLTIDDVLQGPKS